MLVHKIINPP
ncbi:hypothetical protein CGLO_13836 [Colletotrichum gloeosporioides Cg-14]|uniref:Uncharacterized protein n=1 Tax=Colletotrichum gloeosporioides (strain Cg-14) TaxID=1237896 RepID=T0L663_COLGC|nr:hypothetical protein CGLO_13836 [Colletotrichum gloeosporioides Cg-14]